MTKKIALISTFLFIVLASKAQDHFQWKTAVEQPPESGFCKIYLCPEITSKLNERFTDIRIFDKENIETPYILQREKPATQTTLFNEYKIIEKKYNKAKGYTRLIIHNPQRKEIRNIVLEIKNADVKKWLTLNAGNDMENWYVLKDQYRFHSFYNHRGTSEIQILNFPLSDYEYYELIVYDYFDRPINILRAGYYDTSIEKGKYTTLPNPQIEQKDTAKQSRISIRFNESQYIDKLEFDIEGADYYLRKATLSVIQKSPKPQSNQPSQQQTRNYTIKNFELRSFSRNILYLDKIAAKELEIIIENNDNPPLKMKNIKAAQLNTYLIGSLDTANRYMLRFGKPEIQAPVYDLEYFIDSIPENIPKLETKTLVEIKKEEKAPETKKLSSWFIWLALGIVVLFLGYMTLRMVGEVKKR